MALFAFAQFAQATTVITFEGLPVDQPVGAFYSANYGVNFNNATVQSDNGSGFAHSGTNYVSLCFGIEGCVNPLQINFRGPQTRVKVWVGYSGYVLTTSQVVTLQAFDSNGVSLGQVQASLGPTSTGVIPINTPLEISVANIMSAQVSFASGGPFNSTLCVDDVEFDGSSPPPCLGPPSVSITSLTSGQEIDATQTTITGTATVNNPPGQATLTATSLRLAPNDFPPPSFAYFQFTSGGGNSGTFSQSIALPYGYLNISVQIIDVCGYLAASSVTVLNLPQALQNRFTSQGGAAVAGNLDWVISDGECVTAAYDNFAVSYQKATGDTFLISGLIYAKWKDWVSKPYHEGVPDFCPLAEEQQDSAGFDFQDFGSGRIYYWQRASGPDMGPYFVPRVFADALITMAGLPPLADTSGEFPLADPTQSPASHTWIFQQFKRFDPTIGFDDPNAGLPETLEIKGDPPGLWVERQGDDLTALRELKLQSIIPGVGTIARAFPCDTTIGPSHVATPSSPPADFSHLSSVCNGYYTQGDVREWEPVTTDCQLTAAYGFISDPHLSKSDDKFTHPYGQDWNWEFVPVHPYKNLISQYNGTINNTTDGTMEIEIENYYLLYTGFGLFGSPAAGDLSFVCGRWIEDCGPHSDAPGTPTEIHPPSIMGYFRTYGGPATVATLFVDPFYSGDPVSVNVYPPPRPAANAFMQITKTTDIDATAGINVDYDIDPDWSSLVTVKFSAPHQCPYVRVDGVVVAAGRGYYGTWTIGWQTDPAYNVETFDY